MSKKKSRKSITVARTRAGFDMRIRVDVRDNTALPTNWKQQAAVLSNMDKLRAPKVKENA